MGLPNVAFYPEAIVTRDEESILIRFGGPDGEQTMSVPLKYVGGDAEAAELRLLLSDLLEEEEKLRVALEEI